MKTILKNWYLSSGPSGPSYDPVAQAFITAGGTDGTTLQKNAINTFVLTVRDTYGIAINRILGLWPMMGGTAGSNKVDLINPGVNDLIFHGGIVHSATGVKYNGTTGYAQMTIKPSDSGSKDDLCFGCYIGADMIEPNIAMGAFNGTNLCAIYPTEANTFSIYISELLGSTFSTNFSKGFTVANRSASNSIKGDRNGAIVINAITASAAIVSVEFYSGCTNSSGAPAFFTDFEHRLDFIAKHLTDTERANLYTAVQTLQTTLGRNV